MKRFLIIGLGLVFLASCNPQKTEQRGSDQTDQDNDGVWELPNYTYTDSLMQGSHKVVFTITSQPDDTITSQPDEELPEVVDEDGVKYRDNRFNLLIVKDGRTLFEHSFTKADFKSKLSEDFQKYGIMDGMSFNHAKEGKLYFNACVSFPESDMSCPFILTIGPDGSYTITPDTSFDEADETFPSI